MMCYLFNEAQNQRQYDENDAHPFGHTRECGVQGLGFALGEKCLGAVAGHGAGKTAALSGLEEHNSWTTVKMMVRAFTRFNPFY